MELISHSNGTEAVNFGGINLPLTLDCGQAFRWRSNMDNTFTGIAFGRELTVSPTDNGMFFYNTDITEIEEIWADYFDLNRDYPAIIKRISRDKYVKKAVDKYGVIRILNQEPWETLCSFIISSCNNIPRIKSIINTLCESFGEKTGSGYSFPSAEVIAEKTPEQLSVLRAGYRVPYILDAAQKLADGEIDPQRLRTLSENEARNELMKIRGVGKKVADCTMLFSLGFTDVYPVDRHIERATKEYYPLGLPPCFSPHSGLGQQYIFSERIEKH